MTNRLQPEIEARKSAPTPVGSPKETQIRSPLLSVDLQIRLRGELYELNLARLLKWVALLAVAAMRIYRAF